MIASRIEDDTRLIAELAGLIEQEVGPDETYRCLLTVPGVGPRTAAQLALSVDISDFEDHDHWPATAGWRPGTASRAPRSARSRPPGGATSSSRTCSYSAAPALRGSGYYREYYERCRERGMSYKAAIKAVARKRLKVIYAVMRDVRPYVA